MKRFSSISCVRMNVAETDGKIFRENPTNKQNIKQCLKFILRMLRNDE